MRAFAALALLFSSLLTFAAENVITYPDRAWSLDQRGYVKVVYDINSRGKPENVRIEEAEPKFLFSDSVKEQIYGWQFAPGKPEKDVRKTISFEKPNKG